MSQILIDKIQDSDRQWIPSFIRDKWGSERIVCLQREIYPHVLDGFVAKLNDQMIGLITYSIKGNECEIITLNSEKPGLRIGTQLINQVREIALEKKCTRLFLFTTNDNIQAVGFYLKTGFRLVKIHLDALKTDRSIKPEIPLIGESGLPLRDYLEFEMEL